MPLTDLLKPSAPAAPADQAGTAVTPGVREGALLSREDADSFRKLGVEIELKSPLGTFWLVSARTGKDRLELTPEDAITMVNVLHVFGGRVAALTRDGKPLPDADPHALAAAEEPIPEPEPTADDAREHLRRLRGRTQPTATAPEPKAPPAQTSLFAKDKAR